MRSDRVTFPGALGHPLAARLEGAGADVRHYALFAHCFTCSKDLKAVRTISRQLVDRGIAVLRFDFTGLGESEGEFADTNFTSNVEDLLAAAEYLRANFRAPTLLIGHSLGGAAVLTAAAKISESKAVVTLAAPSGTCHLRESLVRSNPQLAQSDEAEVVLAGRPFKLRQQLLDDLAEDRVLDAVKTLDRALLIFHSPVDDVVDIDHARRIYQAAQHPKSFVSLDKADHLLLHHAADAEYVAEVLGAWASRYLQLEPPSEAVDDSVEELPAGEVLVQGGEGLQVRIQAGRHQFLGDEPERVGGKDFGPDPYGFLLSALGACTAMTMRLYADRKGWDFQSAEIRLQHQKIHAKDCAECETASGKIDLINKEIRLLGDLDGTQKERLMEIADRCPVHRSLTSEMVIRSRQV